MLLQRFNFTLIVSLHSKFSSSSSMTERQRSNALVPVTVGWIGLGGVSRIGIVRRPANAVDFSVEVTRGFDSVGWIVRGFFKRLRYGTLVRGEGLIDLFVIDRLGGHGISEDNRFKVVYVFDVKTGGVPFVRSRANVEVILGAKNFSLPSVTNLWSGAEWLEREAWDMSGVRFTGHPDLRRLLTDYGFRGFPMRKEFPPYGFKQVRYDERAGSVVYERLELAQQERDVHLINPWHLSWSSLETEERPKFLLYRGWDLYAFAFGCRSRDGTKKPE